MRERLLFMRERDSTLWGWHVRVTNITDELNCGPLKYKIQLIKTTLGIYAIYNGIKKYP